MPHLARVALAAPPAGVPDLARLAHHADAAEDDDAVLRFAPAAAARASKHGAHREAASLYARTLRAVAAVPLSSRAKGLETDVPVTCDDPYALEMAGKWARAAESWAMIGCPYESALALASAGDEPGLRRALTELQRLGARPAAGIVTRRLHERGGRGVPRGPRRVTQHNPASLTAREIEVLALIAQGLRNTDVAERLFLSPKTVDHHVSAILRKPGVRTRGQASGEAARLGLTSPR